MEEMQIIKQVKDKVPHSFDLILNNYANMIFFIINKIQIKSFGDYALNIDDLYQEGCIGLYNACLHYRYDSNAQFSTFAYMVIKRRIEHKARTLMHQLFNEPYSTDAVNEIDYFSYYIKEDAKNSIKDDERYYYVSTYLNTLPINELNVIKMYYQGSSYKQIAKELNIPTKRVDNILAKVKRNCRKYLQEKQKSEI